MILHGACPHLRLEGSTTALHLLQWIGLKLHAPSNTKPPIHVHTIVHVVYQVVRYTIPPMLMPSFTLMALSTPIRMAVLHVLALLHFATSGGIVHTCSLILLGKEQLTQSTGLSYLLFTKRCCGHRANRLSHNTLPSTLIVYLCYSPSESSCTIPARNAFTFTCRSCKLLCR
jgi:hypothetical protein